MKKIIVSPCEGRWQAETKVNGKLVVKRDNTYWGAVGELIGVNPTTFGIRIKQGSAVEDPRTPLERERGY